MTTRIWTAETDTLPWMHHDHPGAVMLPIGTWSDEGTVDVTVRATVDGMPVPARVEPVDIGKFDQLRRDPPSRDPSEPMGVGRYRHFVDMARRSSDNRYFTATLTDVPVGAIVEYECMALIAGRRVAATARLRLRAVLHRFSVDDLCAAFTPGGDNRSSDADATWWVLLYHRDADFDHFRLDFLGRTWDDDARPSIVLDVDGLCVDVAASYEPPAEGSEAVPLAFLDRSTDSVLLSVPRPDGPSIATPSGTGRGPLPTVHVTAGGVRSGPVDLTARLAPARLMIINYCIQGLNDLFELPVTGYDPPRTYMQLTMNDEKAQYSSRPGTRENKEPDGYALTFEAHRRHFVKSHWAFNAGVLTLMSHDSPAELDDLIKDIARGDLSPSNAGFGAHRPPYYARPTNVEELIRGSDVLRAVLGHCDGVYYPDQRIYKATADEVAAYDDYRRRDAHPGPYYLVLDRSTLCYQDNGQPRQHFPSSTSGACWIGSRFAEGNRLWRDGKTGYRLLLIDDDVRDGLLRSGGDELDRGKVRLDLRRMFMKALCDPSPHRPLFVYGDDADKASGNGWFDGDYSGLFRYNLAYHAALAWIQRHPWVQAITTTDLDRDPGNIVELPVSSAICPSVDPDGEITRDKQQEPIHFDSWYNEWKVYPSPWLGRSLESISNEVESALLRVKSDQVDPDLLDIAWSSYLHGTHESFWSTQPLESDPNKSEPGRPEDFVLAESLQIRNALVYLHAASWARLAADTSDPRTYRDDDGWLRQAFPRDGWRHWDGDLLPNTLLYNRQALLVLDANGGRITHIFLRRAGRSFCVSGNCKAYQFVRPAVAGQQELTCDGMVLQNTVWTPNHAYVACDSVLAQPLPGRRPPRFPGRGEQDGDRTWLYPDNFNEYDVGGDESTVVFSYGPGTEDPPAQLDERTFTEACQRDRESRQHGGRVVWHQPEHVGLRKRIALDGRHVLVDYDDAQPGHVVANEFCLDLQRGLRSRTAQRTTVAANGRSITVANDGGLELTLRPGAGCTFSPALLQPDPPPVDRLRLHRVLTDNLELAATDTSFSYRIDLPGD